MRLNRYLASAGLGSRRACDDLIVSGRVSINGQPCITLGTLVEEGDIVKVGSRVVSAEVKMYVLLHKPKGYVTTRSDPEGRRTIFELLPADWPRLFHVGRLDQESEGLLLLTNDGDLSQHLSHPSHGIDKEYETFIDRNFEDKDGARLVRGMTIDGSRARMEKVYQVAPRHLKIVLHQGLKRQIRQMLYFLGYEVERLRRVRIGNLSIDGLPSGAWRYLTHREISDLRKITDTAAPKPARPVSDREANRVARARRLAIVEPSAEPESSPED